MAFERTAAGQSNRALFFQCDLICYVEGNEDDAYGVDIIFWAGVFDSLLPNVQVHLVARGGKPVLEALAKQIVDDEISNTIVAMDRDYTPFRPGRLIADTRVLYTFGYSWENDVFSHEQVPYIVRRLARIGSLPAAHRHDLIRDFQHLDAGVGKFIFADFAALLRGGSVFDRAKPGRYCTVDGVGRPLVAKDRCREDVNKARANLAGRVVREALAYPNERSRYLWGKAFEHFVRLGIAKTVRDLCGRTFAPEHIRDVALICFGQCLATGRRSTVLDYYRQVCALIPV